jgi:uncharacterized membrane protein
MEYLNLILGSLTFTGILGTIAGTFYGVRQKTIIEVLEALNKAYVERNNQLETLHDPQPGRLTTVHSKIKNKIRRANAAILLCLIGILIINCILGAALVAITVVNGDRTREAATQLHLRTQQYVKCIAEVLVIPIANRDEKAIDNCTTQADINTQPVE